MTTGGRSTAFRKGDVVLVPFPFTDLTATRVRPAVVVTTEEFESETGDVIVAMVTSQRYNGRTDHALSDWREAGLLYPSWLRVKLATLERRLIIHSLGSLSSRDAAGVDRVLQSALGLA